MYAGKEDNPAQSVHRRQMNRLQADVHCEQDIPYHTCLLNHQYMF